MSPKKASQPKKVDVDLNIICGFTGVYWTQEQVEARVTMPEITAPKSYTKADSIAAYIDDAKAKWVEKMQDNLHLMDPTKIGFKVWSNDRGITPQLFVATTWEEAVTKLVNVIDGRLDPHTQWNTEWYGYCPAQIRRRLRTTAALMYDPTSSACEQWFNNINIMDSYQSYTVEALFETMPPSEQKRAQEKLYEQFRLSSASDVPFNKLGLAENIEHCLNFVHFVFKAHGVIK